MLWLSHPPNKRKVARLSLAKNSFYSSHPRKADISCCHRHSTKASFVLNMSITANYGRFSLDVIASMLVHRPIKKRLLWQFDSIIIQILSHHLRLFCAPTWPSYDVIGEHLLINKSAMLHTINHRQGIRGTTGKVLEAFQGAVFLLTFESLIKSLIIVQYQK